MSLPGIPVGLRSDDGTSAVRVRPRVRPRYGLAGLALGLAGLLGSADPAFPAEESLKTENRMPFRHVIPLRDAAGDMITLPEAVDAEGKPQEARGAPLSIAQTCGRCHDYPAISRGWHFNAHRPEVKPGRPGEPWILTDAATRTQIPLSYRAWPGTFRPADLGLSDYDVLLTFARHLPGGGIGDRPPDQVNTNDVRLRRFLITGSLEVDCLICHNRHGDYDHEARAKAIAAENFKWAPAIASELGAYGASRNAKTFADSWRPPRPAPANLPPIKYERRRFDLANHVDIAVTRRPPAENCYYCHTANTRSADGRWHADGDVHLRAGMACVDCHRNGIDHMIVRGYEGETADRTLTEESLALRTLMLQRNDPALQEAEARRRAEALLSAELGRVETLSCRGCHYGSADGAAPGRLGAPRPHHAGLPPVHFEKLACTACHSGPVPADATEIVHTSLAHKLGLPAPARGENTQPTIVQPVFLRDGTGRIAPHRMVWPSFWGLLKDGQVKPLLPDDVAKRAGDKLPSQPRDDVARDPYNTRPLSEAQIREVLGALAGNAGEATNGAPVFVAAGRMWRLEGAQAVSGDHESARPYAWPLGHDVRPASQSVGVRGCADCHAGDAPIYFASVTARGPVEPKPEDRRPQWSMRGEDPAAASFFAFTFNFRPTLKVVTFGCALIILGVLLGRFLFVLGGSRPSDRRDSN